MNGRTRSGAWLLAAIVVGSAPAQSSPQPAPPVAPAVQPGDASKPVVHTLAAEAAGTDALAAAWLHDLLGSQPEVTLAAYRVVVGDDGESHMQRIRAAARALPFATGLGDQDAALACAQLIMQLGNWRDAEPRFVLARLTAVQDALRAWAANESVTEGELRGIVQRISSEPWRTLDNLALRPPPNTDTLERLLRAAEAKGDRAEAARLRQSLTADSGQEIGRPRAIQQRRWARDVLQWELAGQRDKAARMYPAVVRRREGRPALTLQRFENAMANVDARQLAESERQLLTRALQEARLRVRAGDARGAALLIGPALTLLRVTD